jgi:multidrug efflux pump
VENAIYTNSVATPDGSFSITVTFRLGTDLDIAQVQTQNRVSAGRDAPARRGAPTRPGHAEALARPHHGGVPEVGRRRYDSLYLRNYAVIQIKDVLARLQGMGDVEVFGSGDYAMRLWLDPAKIAARNMDVDEVLNAVREQNVQVAAGQIGGQPALPGTSSNTSSTPRAGCRPSRSSEHRRQERRQRRDHVFARHRAHSNSGPDNYALRSMLDGGPAVAIPVFQLPGANACSCRRGARHHEGARQELSRRA